MDQRGGITRRGFIKAVAAGAGLLVLPGDLHAFGDDSKLRFSTLRHNNPENDARNDGLRRLCFEIMQRTSLEMDLASSSVSMEDDTLFDTPLLYLYGDQPFNPWPESWVFALNRHLTYGGFLLVDSDATAGEGFDQSIRREVARIFPGREMVKLDREHTVYKSFYLLTEQAGRIMEKPYLEGVDVDDRTPLVYCRNDLAGAWSRDSLGAWRFPVTPGGDRQREMAFRFGVNLVMYAVCVNYKADQVHIPFILKRRR